MLHDNGIAIPSQEECKKHIINTFITYWGGNERFLENIPINKIDISELFIPLELKEIVLPEWASHYGVNGKLLIPQEIVLNGSSNWKDIDWWTAAFLLLEAWHERFFEKTTGRTIHSYSLRLKAWDSRVWDRAWVNRIALFIRAWAANLLNESEEKLFGVLPESQIVMTHDVDAIDHTWSIRIKQTVFNSFNFFRSALLGKWASARTAMEKVFVFLFKKEDWWKLDETIEIENQAGIKSWLNFYAGRGKITLKKWVFDPGYQLENQRLSNFISNASNAGFRIGFHPSYDSWNDEESMTKELAHLRKNTMIHVNQCRQHWLRFSWFRTWQIQISAGIKLDTTLMFNDRAGFRCAAAIMYHPWDSDSNKAYLLTELPTVIMDSHLYDYKQMNNSERVEEINKWVTEIEAVHGQCAVLWHPHTLTDTYGWKEGFVLLTERIKK